jgi:hypothetical protein
MDNKPKELSNIKHRLWLSQWCCLIICHDDTIAIVRGTKRLELSAYETTRLTFALQNAIQQRDDAAYEAAKADESKAFIDAEALADAEAWAYEADDNSYGTAKWS